VTICGFAELAPELFHESFPLPLRAVGFGDVSGTSKSVALGGVVTDTYGHIQWKGQTVVAPVVLNA